MASQLTSTDTKRERERERDLFDVKARANIHQDFLAVRQAAANIERRGQRDENLVPPGGAFLARANDAVVDRAHAVAELGLRRAKLRVRRSQMLELARQTALKTAQLRGRQRSNVHFTLGVLAVVVVVAPPTLQPGVLAFLSAARRKKKKQTKGCFLRTCAWRSGVCFCTPCQGLCR